MSMTRCWALGAGVVVALLMGCGDSSDPATTTGPGGGGAGGETTCPPGSHPEGASRCAATLGAFFETSSISEARDHHVTWAATRPGGRFVYVAGGGLNMMSGVASIERASIGDDGMLGAWQTLPATMPAIGPMVASTDARALIAGGIRTGSVRTTTQSATIGDDGALGAFEPGPDLNIPRFHGAAVLHDGWIYAAGGLDASGTSSAVIERVAFDDAGPQGSWIVEGNDMPEQRSHHGFAVHERALYVTGGLTRIDNQFNADVPYDTVLRSPIQPDGSIGTWSIVGTLPVPLAVHASFVHVGQLYVVGGLDMSSLQFSDTVWRATLLEDGSLGSWERLEPRLPLTRGHCHQTPLVDGYLYSIAGTNNAGSQTNAFVAKLE